MTKHRFKITGYEIIPRTRVVVASDYEAAVEKVSRMMGREGRETTGTFRHEDLGPIAED